MSVTADTTTIAALAAAATGVIVLFFLLLIRRADAFSRHIDARRVRRAKFQDEWAEVLRAADDFARVSSEGRRQGKRALGDEPAPVDRGEDHEWHDEDGSSPRERQRRRATRAPEST